ncbi:hypothetical protein SALBM311S_09869 [Streptomyces alboniger]
MNKTTEQSTQALRPPAGTSAVDDRPECWLSMAFRCPRVRWT